MPKPDPDRRLTVERRKLPDRRAEGEQGEEGGGERRSETEAQVPVDRRTGAERRQIGERRSAIERRLALQSAADQIHGALKLLTRVAESEGGGSLNEEQRRELEGAMLRLRFALERLEEE